MGGESRTDILIFRAGERVCGIRSNHIAELVLAPEWIQVAGQPAVLDGFFALRGVVAPVVPIHRLFGWSVPERRLYTPLLVLSTDRYPVALRVDAVDELASVDEGEIVPCSPMDSLNECAEGYFRLQGQEVVLLAPERLLFAKERQCIADLEDRARERLAALER